MMKYFIGSAFAFLCVALLSLPASAQVSAAATAYNITVNKAELCSSAACADPFVVANASKGFDIASGTVGSAIGSYTSLESLPKDRTFTHIRVTLSRTIGVAGSTADPGNVGGTCGTDSGDASATPTIAGVGIIGGGGTEQNLVAPDEAAFGGGTVPPVGSYAALGITLTSATEMTFMTALATPFTMTDVPPVIDIAFETAAGTQSFDSNGGVAGGNCSMLPGVPVVSVSISE